MPRESPFVIVLTENEREYLEGICRKYTSPYISVIRAKIVLYASEGLENEAIARKIGLPRQVVSKWRKRFCKERLDGLQERPRQGRPPLFPPRADC